jgi:hypothetical protein
MLILRDKSYSIESNIDSKVVDFADRWDKINEMAENSHPIIKNSSKRWRKRISGYTKPIKKLIGNKNK